MKGDMIEPNDYCEHVLRELFNKLSDEYGICVESCSVKEYKDYDEFIVEMIHWNQKHTFRRCVSYLEDLPLSQITDVILNEIDY